METFSDDKASCMQSTKCAGSVLLKAEQQYLGEVDTVLYTEHAVDAHIEPTKTMLCLLVSELQI